MSSVRKQYRIGMAVVAAVAAAGFVLQFIAGPLEITLLSFPVNALLAGLVILAVGALAVYREKGAFRLLSGIPFSVSVMGAVLVSCVVMGLIPQSSGGSGMNGVVSRAGLDAVASSWPFALIYITLLLSLGCVVAAALIRFDIRRWDFYLNHLGLWLVFLGVGLGSADMRELTVRIPEGGTAFHWVGRSGMPERIPFEVGLEDFTMEEYPVKWGIVDIRTGKFQPEKKPRFYATEEEAFGHNPSPAMHERVASTLPQPKSFGSHITVIGPDGVRESAVVEVNRPYRRGSWSVYQSGYDTEAGPDSAYSVLKAVRDPWLPVVYAGIAMLALGALSMMLKRRKNELG